MFTVRNYFSFLYLASAMIFVIAVITVFPDATFAQEIKPLPSDFLDKKHTYVQPSGNLNLEIHHIHVGAGDSTLIITPSGATILINAGDSVGGRKYVSGYLRKNGITRIDYLVATNGDYVFEGDAPNNIDGLIQILKSKKIDVWRVIINREAGGKYVERYSLSFMKEAIKNVLDGIYYMPPGHVWDIGSKAKITCIYSNGKTISGKVVNELINTKKFELDRAICLLIDYKGFQYFTGANIHGENGKYGIDVESVIADDVGDLDVLKVNNNGRDSASNMKFLSTTKPEISIISAEQKDKFFYDPDNSVTDRLVENGSDVIMTGYDDEDANYYKNTMLMKTPIVKVGKGKVYEINGMKKYKDEKIPDNNDVPQTQFTAAQQDNLNDIIVSLDASQTSDSDNISCYYWDFGNGSQFLTKDSKITYKYSSDGDYTINLYAQDKYGKGNFATSDLKVLPAGLVIDYETHGSTSAMANISMHVTVKTISGKPVVNARVRAYVKFNAFSSSDSNYTDENGFVRLYLKNNTYFSGFYRGDIDVYIDGKLADTKEFIVIVL